MPTNVELDDEEVEEQPSLANVPDFEKPVARRLTLAPGNRNDAIAHYQGGNTVYVDDPRRATQPVINHEVFHAVQEQAGNQQADPQSDRPSDYSYGGVAGLTRLRREGKSIASLNIEQQANIPQDYTAQMAFWRRPGKLSPQGLRNADAMNAAYAAPLRQEAEMARTEPGINTTPPAPGPPPAALTGMIVPLPEIGGNSIMIRPGKGQAISTQTAKAYYQKAGGDPDKARALAQSHGWKVPKN